MRILLISENVRVYHVTKKIANTWFELIWNNYSELIEGTIPVSDAIILDFDKSRAREGIFQTIVKIKSKSNSIIPILVIYRGTPQEIYTALKAGAYDYIDSIENEFEYRKKIKDIFLWIWYQKKYGINIE